ncbi:DUF2764 family protein, partial [Verrucomicrobiota bacterium]
PLISSEAFIALCGEHLTQRDRDAAVALVRGEGSGSNHPFVRAWTDSETRLRNAVARTRAARSGADAEPFLREECGFEADVEPTVAEAFAADTPLERERRLDRFRWQRVEELQGYDPFSTNAVLAYAVKLALAERWAKMDEDEGNRRAEAVIGRDPGEPDAPPGRE